MTHDFLTIQTLRVLPALRVCLFYLLLSIFGQPVIAQPIWPDSTQQAAGLDSTVFAMPQTEADSIRGHIRGIQSQLRTKDTLAVSPDILGRPAEVVNYQADSIYYDVDSRQLIMRGKVTITYNDLKLTAGRVNYFSRTEIFEAEDGPTLYEGRDKLVGERMKYHIRTRQGRVDNGRSQYDKGYYFGEEIRKVDEKTLLIRNGYYTTCDREKPHYTFRSKRMKIILKDKVIVQPVLMYLGKVPVLGLPFYIFPIRTGRTSGFLTPQLGSNNRDGRFIRNLGYYWATNDYMDLTGRLSVREYTGLEVGADYVYALRHRLSGNVSFDYDWNVDGQDRSSVSWRLTGAHNQTLGERFRLTASANFVSSKSYYRNTSDEEDKRTQGLLQSYITLDKSWDRSSLRARSAYTRSLVTDLRTAQLPEISFTTGANLFTAKRGSALEKWSPSLTFSAQTGLDQKYTTDVRSLTKTIADSIITETRDVTRHDWSAQQNFALSFSLRPQTVYWLNLNLGTSLSDTWRKVHQEGVVDSTLETYTLPVTGNSHRFTPGVISLTGNTSIYGIFQTRFGNLRAIRHTVRPTVSTSYNPQVYFEDAGYGFNLKKETTGATPGSSKFSVSSIGLGNTFEAKVKSDTTTGGKESTRNIQLFTLDFGSSFRKVNEQWRISDISANLATRISALSVTANTSYNPYENQFGLSTVSTNITVQLGQNRVSGWFNAIRRKFKGDSPDSSLTAEISPADSLAAEPLDEAPVDSLTTRPAPTDSADTDGQLPGRPDAIENSRLAKSVAGLGENRWNLALTHSYNRSFDISGIDAIDRPAVSNLTGAFTLKLTKKWDISYQPYYDLARKKMITQNLEIRRDLHCWQAFFQWTSRENGTWSYYFIINIKEIPEVKFEEKRSKR